MFDLGWSELLLIGIIALIVVGPKDLPGMFRTLGRFTAKARSLAREFQSAMNAAADETGVRDVERDLRETTSSKSMGLDTLDEAAKSFESWKPDLRGAAKPGGETEEMAERRAREAAGHAAAAGSEPRTSDAQGGAEAAPAGAPGDSAAPADDPGGEADSAGRDDDTTGGAPSA